MKKRAAFLSLIATTIFYFLYQLYALVNFPSYYQEVPVTFTPSEMPLMQTDIEGTSYPISLDLGSKLPLTLCKTVLQRISKIKHGTAQWKDIRGHSYESPSYLLKHIHIGTLRISDIIANEESDLFQKNATLWEGRPSQRKEKVGAFGRPILKEFNLFLDFPNNRIIACSRLEDLKQAGVKIEYMMKTSFQETTRGLILSINTDLGIKKFALDTGATMNFLKASLLKDQEVGAKNHGVPTFLSKRCVIGEKNLGPITFYLVEMTSELYEIDGLLGMDFFKKHSIYIDYRNQTLYLYKDIKDKL